MKKATLIIAMLVITSFAIAQVGFVPQKQTRQVFEPGKALKASPAKKAPGDIIWATDFNEAEWSGTSDNGEPVPDNAPAGWALGDMNNMGYYFRWDTVGARGIYTSLGGDCNEPNEATYTTTQSNGYLMLELDHFNSSADCTTPFSEVMDSYIEYNAGIDFSDRDAVHLVFEQANRFCCSRFSSEIGAFFKVSVDNGATWTNYPVNVGDINTGVSNPGEPGYITEIDITESVANEPNVIFRFQSTGHEAYYWIIDDVSFVVPMANDMRYWDYWNDYITYRDDSPDYPINARKDFTEGFYEYPWFLIQEFKGFHAAFHNFGSAIQTNHKHTIEIWKNSELEYTFTSEPIASMMPGYRDTSMIMQDWWPTDTGLYDIIHYPDTDTEDENTGNDTLYRHMKIGLNTVSPINFDDINDIISPDNWSKFNEDGDGLGFMLNIPDPGLHGEQGADYYILKGISVYIDNNDREEISLFQNGEARIVAAVYKYNEENDQYVEQISSPEYSLSTDDTASIVYIPFPPDGTSEYLFQAGDYVIAMHMYGTWVNDYGVLQGWNIYNSNNDMYKRSPESAVSVNASVQTSDDVGYVLEGPAISLNIEFSKDYVGIPGNDIQNLEFSMFPNPSNGNVHINAKGTSHVTIFNIAGKIVDDRIINGSQNIDLDINNGVYLVRVQNGNKVGTQRLIIE